MRIFTFALSAMFIIGAAPAMADDADAGRTTFQQLCAMCHGQTGQGDGAASAALTPKPRDMSDSEWQASVDDEYLTKVIREGGPAVGLSPQMMGFGRNLNEQQIENVVAYIRTLDD
jgi:mono/diheme cytochrome c family protein